MRALLIIGLVNICLISYSQDKVTNIPSIHSTLQETTDEIIDSLISIRRYLHEHPEISGVERNTFEFLSNYLKSLKIKVYTNITIPEYLHSKFLETDINDNLVSVNYVGKYPTVKNNADLSHQAFETISSLYGKKSIKLLYGVIPNRNDDFAHFQLKTPGVYFFLGASNFENGIIALPHAPFFAVDESCIKYGINYFSSFIYEQIQK